MRPMKKIALLHDLCGVGKAALTNMMPILSVMGIESCPIPTMLLSTHTGGYGTPAVARIPAEYIRNCADHFKNQGVEFDAIFIGYLGHMEAIDAVIYLCGTVSGNQGDPGSDHGRSRLLLSEF